MRRPATPSSPATSPTCLVRRSTASASPPPPDIERGSSATSTPDGQGVAHRDRLCIGIASASGYRRGVRVPVVDVAPLIGAGTVGEVRAVAEAIDSACSDLGFFVISGHGIDPRLRRDLDEAAREFFALAEETKAAIAMPRAGLAWRGWFPVGGELTSGRPDLKEGIYFGEEHGVDHPGVRGGRPLHGANLFPQQPARLRPLVLRYLDALTTLGQRVLEGVAVGLGLPRDWFRAQLTADPVVLFRIFHYPPSEPAT